MNIKNNKGFSLIEVVIVLAIVAILGFVGYSALTMNNDENTSTEESAQQEEANARESERYTDDDGYSFIPPENWITQEQYNQEQSSDDLSVNVDVNDVAFYAPAGEGFGRANLNVNIEEEIPAGESIESYVEAVVGFVGQALQNYEYTQSEFTINGVDGIVIEATYTLQGMAMNNRQAIYEKDGKLYVLTFTAANEDWTELEPVAIAVEQSFIIN